MDIIKNKDRILEELLPKMHDQQLRGVFLDLESYLVKNFLIDDLTDRPYVLNRFIQIMVDKNLILESNDSAKSLTSKAKRIVESGGWKKHSRTLYRKQLIIKLTIYVYPIFALAIAAYSSYYSKISFEALKDIEILKNRIQQIDSTNIRLQESIHLIQTKYDSLSQANHRTDNK